ncbi:type III polyketide synthase [Rubritalea sp.]|uniref:type III polyketide synthase n=1 Tax=Rubritalea sp. TaxID=2109375 RepID=UPI003EF7A585
MKLNSVASAFPPYAYSQLECLEAMRGAPFWEGLSARSRLVLEKVLSGNSGIEKRHFCVDSLEAAWSRNAQELNEAYEREAPKLAAEAVRKAIAKSGHAPAEIDALFLCSCTGFLCPGVSSYVAEELGLRADVFLQDMTGLGCGAGVPLLRVAKGVMADNPDAVVVTVAVEVCSAAFYVEDDFGVLISTCIFGDGAAAAVWTGEQGGWQLDHFQSLHLPEHREKIRFTNAGGKLRNQLEKSVPKLAGLAVKELYAKRRIQNPDAWVTHGGGRDVLEELDLVLPDVSLARSVMNEYGNLSSPSVLVALERFIENQGDEFASAWLCAFGAGFSAHSCELTLE